VEGAGISSSNNSNAKSKLNSNGAKGFCVGGGRAPLDYYNIRQLGRTHKHFKVTSFLKLWVGIFSVERVIPF
jgi:hypothetical protein